MTKPEQEATPRPWRVWDNFEISAHSPDDNAEIATVYQCGGIREVDEAIANAELIVKAVNSYDAMRRALLRMRCTCDASNRYGHYDNAHCNLTIANAALTEQTEAKPHERK